MKPLKIAGIVVVALWMAWVTFQLNRMYDLETEICGIAFGKMPDGSLRFPLSCPATGPGVGSGLPAHIKSN